MKNIAAIFVALLVVLVALTACTPATPAPTDTPAVWVTTAEPTVAPVEGSIPTAAAIPTEPPVSTPDPNLTLPELAALVCQEQALDQAAAYVSTGRASHKIVIVGPNGGQHEWNAMLPAAMQAASAGELEAVLCLENQAPEKDPWSTCGQYTSSFGQTVTLPMGEYHLAAKLVAAQTGQSIQRYTVKGGMAPTCPDNISSSDPRMVNGVLYGEPVTLNGLLNEAAPDLIPGLTSQVIETAAGYVYGVAVSNDGTRLATVQDGSSAAPFTVHVWDTASDTELAKLVGHDTYVKALAFSTDRSLLASSDDSGKIIVWDLATGAPRVLAEGDSANRDAIQLAFSPDGKTLASSGSDSFLRIWNVASGKMMKKLKSDGGGGKLVYSNDGARLIVVNRENLELWDMQTNHTIGEMFDANRSLAWAGFYPDGKRVEALNFEIDRYKTTELDAETGKRIEEQDWIEFGQQMTNYLDPLILPGLQWLVVTDQGYNRILWDMQMNTELTWLRKGPEATYSDESALGASANGKFLAIGDKDGYVNLWDFSWGANVADAP